jgi:hypothetical protein
MRASVSQGEGISCAVAADDQRQLKQRGFVELIALDTVSRQCAIPETGEHERVGRLALREVEFGHVREIVAC